LRFNHKKKSIVFVLEKIIKNERKKSIPSPIYFIENG